jgi:hypothetical protein
MDRVSQGKPDCHYHVIYKDSDSVVKLPRPVLKAHPLCSNLRLMFRRRLGVPYQGKFIRKRCPGNLDIEAGFYLDFVPAFLKIRPFSSGWKQAWRLMAPDFRASCGALHLHDNPEGRRSRS